MKVELIRAGQNKNTFPFWIFFLGGGGEGTTIYYTNCIKIIKLKVLKIKLSVKVFFFNVLQSGVNKIIWSTI